MTRYLIGYKQGDNSYVYVTGISATNISVNTIVENAINFDTQKMATGVLEYVNILDKAKEYTVIKVTTEIEEV